LVSVLKDRGYLIVRLPRGDIAPLLLIRKGDDGNFERVGQLADGFVPGEDIAVPAVRSDIPVADLDGKRTSDLEVGADVDLIGSLVGALGGSDIGLEAQYRQGSKFSLSIHNVREDAVDPLDIDQYLVDAKVHPKTRAFAQWVEDDKIYVIISILKSDQFVTEATKEDGQALKLEVPVIQNIVGGEVAVQRSASSESVLTYKGKVPVTFGFQAVQLIFRDQLYRTLGPARGGALDVRDQLNWLQSEEVRVDVEGESTLEGDEAGATTSEAGNAAQGD